MPALDLQPAHLVRIQHIAGDVRAEGPLAVHQVEKESHRAVGSGNGADRQRHVVLVAPAVAGRNLDRGGNSRRAVDLIRVTPRDGPSIAVIRPRRRHQHEIGVVGFDRLQHVRATDAGTVELELVCVHGIANDDVRTQLESKRGAGDPGEFHLGRLFVADGYTVRRLYGELARRVGRGGTRQRHTHAAVFARVRLAENAHLRVAQRQRLVHTVIARDAR